jgi:methylated-DNA-[protein]-cysteine S-methyltransferase
MTEALHLARLDSPIGRIELAGDGRHLTSLTIERGGMLPRADAPEHRDVVLDEAERQLVEYFDGTRQVFDVPVRLVGTPFQMAVWERLRTLGWGQYTSYAELAAAVGRPLASRAIGGAVGANPVPIIIGCHRVLASNLRITGYSGGEGVPTKVWLLGHEQILFAA